jgi:hypothetical protein
MDGLGKSDWKGFKQRIRIWQAYAITANPDRIACPSGQECYLSGLVQVGRSAASGVKCEAWLVGKPGIRIESVQMPGNSVASQQAASPPPGQDSDTVAKLEWITNPIDKFTELEFSLGLISDTQRSKDDWSQIARLVNLRSADAK